MDCKVRTRIYCQESGSPQLVLDDEDSLAIKRSLRLHEGERISGFNGDGNEYIYSITKAPKNALHLTLLDSFPNPADQLPETTVYIAFTKGKTKDRMVKELPPLGATRIVFYSAYRSISQPDEKQLARLQKIAIESCRQCGRSTIPAVEIRQQNLIDIFKDQNHSYHDLILFWEEAGSDQAISIPDFQKPISLFFGPEGGFTQEEIEVGKEKGIHICTLGWRILRSELAVIVGVSLVQGRRGLFG